MKCGLMALLACLCSSANALEGPQASPTSAGLATTSPADAALLHGRVSHHSYTTAIGMNFPRDLEDYYVYTPPGYDPKSSKKYPVLYLLHGYDQNALGWQKYGAFQTTIDELIANRKARPMIVVMPFGYGDVRFLRAGKLAWLSPRSVDENDALFSQMLLQEILPQVESDYRVSKKREDRAIAGLSMGGREAISISLKNPRIFAWVGGFSAAFPDFGRYQLPPVESEPANYRLFWMASGVEDAALVFKGEMRVIADLNRRGVPVINIVTHGTHDWPVWRQDLKQFLPLLFQSK